MSASLQSWGRMGFAVLALALTSLQGQADDEVSRSFDRMLAHESTTAPSPEADPVVASFSRMLNHQPSRHMPALPADAGTDPLVAAVVLPLLRERTITVAGGAGVSRH